MKSLTSLSEESIQSDNSLPSVMSPDLSLPAQTNAFWKENTFFPLGFTNESASGGELRSINIESSSRKCEAQHSLIIAFGLYRVAKLTPRKKKLYDKIQTRQSALCKLRKKYMTKNLKEVGQVDSNPLIQSLSSSLNVQTARFLATFVWNSRHKLEDMSGISKKRC